MKKREAYAQLKNNPFSKDNYKQLQGSSLVAKEVSGPELPHAVGVDKKKIKNTANKKS